MACKEKPSSLTIFRFMSDGSTSPSVESPKRISPLPVRPGLPVASLLPTVPLSHNNPSLEALKAGQVMSASSNSTIRECNSSNPEKNCQKSFSINPIKEDPT